MAKTEDEIIRTAMQAWRDRDKTNEFWFKSLIQGAWRSGYTNARNELHEAFESATEAEKITAYRGSLTEIPLAKCSQCIEFDTCPWRSGPDAMCSAFKQKPKTNADRIRSMTDEELVEFLAPYNSGCPKEHGSVMACHDNGCYKCWEDWLREEVSD